jgi:hypothetical protein
MRSNLMKSVSSLVLAALLALSPLAAEAGQREHRDKPAHSQQDGAAKKAKAKRQQAKTSAERAQPGKTSAKRKHPAKSSAAPLQGAEVAEQGHPAKPSAKRPLVAKAGKRDHPAKSSTKRFLVASPDAPLQRPHVVGQQGRPAKRPLARHPDLGRSAGLNSGNADDSTSLEEMPRAALKTEAEPLPGEGLIQGIVKGDETDEMMFPGFDPEAEAREEQARVFDQLDRDLGGLTANSEQLRRGRMDAQPDGQPGEMTGQPQAETAGGSDQSINLVPQSNTEATNYSGGRSLFSDKVLGGIMKPERPYSTGSALGLNGSGGKTAGWGGDPNDCKAKCQHHLDDGNAPAYATCWWDCYLTGG